LYRPLFRRSLSMGGAQLAQIPRYALFQLLAPPLDLCAGEVLVAVVHGLELAAINRNACLRQQAHPPAQLDKLRTYLLYRSTVVFAEVRNRLVVWRQPTQQPHHLDVAPRLAFQPPARLHPIEVAIDVELQEG